MGFLVGSATSVYGQTIIRSAIGPMGGSSSSDGITVQYTTGQPYQPKASYEGQSENRPGFIQPSQLMVEFLRSDLPVTLEVFPNPATSVLSFQLEKEVTNVDLKVVDLSGNLVHEETISSLRNFQLDCSSWKNGSYIITLTDKENKTSQSKLIKQ